MPSPVRTRTPVSAASTPAENHRRGMLFMVIATMLFVSLDTTYIANACNQAVDSVGGNPNAVASTMFGFIQGGVRAAQCLLHAIVCR